MLGTACNSVLRLRLGLGRVEQVDAYTSLWRVASWRPIGVFLGQRIERTNNFCRQGYT